MGMPRPVPVTGREVKAVSQEPLRHADAGILHHQLVLAVLMEAELPGLQPDMVSRLRVFHGVGQEVIDNLANLPFIAHHPVVLKIDADLQRFAFFPGPVPEHVR